MKYILPISLLILISLTGKTQCDLSSSGIGTFEGGSSAWLKYTNNMGTITDEVTEVHSRF